MGSQNSGTEFGKLRPHKQGGQPEHGDQSPSTLLGQQASIASWCSNISNTKLKFSSMILANLWTLWHQLTQEFSDQMKGFNILSLMVDCSCTKKIKPGWILMSCCFWSFVSSIISHLSVLVKGQVNRKCGQYGLQVGIAFLGAKGDRLIWQSPGAGESQKRLQHGLLVEISGCFRKVFIGSWGQKTRPEEKKNDGSFKRCSLIAAKKLWEESVCYIRILDRRDVVKCYEWTLVTMSSLSFYLAGLADGHTSSNVSLLLGSPFQVTLSHAWLCWGWFGVHASAKLVVIVNLVDWQCGQSTVRLPSLERLI